MSVYVYCSFSIGVLCSLYSVEKRISNCCVVNLCSMYCGECGLCLRSFSIGVSSFGCRVKKEISNVG